MDTRWIAIAGGLALATGALLYVVMQREGGPPIPRSFRRRDEAEEARKRREGWDDVDEAIDESFPASDPPSYTPGYT